MKISFQTKEESNKKQLEDFLKLSGAERVLSFMRLSTEIKRNFPSQLKSEKSSNFTIVIPPK